METMKDVKAKKAFRKEELKNRNWLIVRVYTLSVLIILAMLSVYYWPGSLVFSAISLIVYFWIGVLTIVSWARVYR